MNLERAHKIILKPHVTEKISAMIEAEGRLCFIVSRTATKHEIAQAIDLLYRQKAVKVNTARTVYGKKAFVQFESASKARDLATDIGML